jgi:hypothetical protein
VRPLSLIRPAVIGLVAVTAALGLVPTAHATGEQVAPVANAQSFQLVDDGQRVGHGRLPGLRFVAVAPVTATVGEQIEVRTWWRDGLGRVYANLEDWGDIGIGSSTPLTCAPGDRTFGGGSGHGVLTHTWNDVGAQTVTLKVTSGGCGIPRQERTVRFVVDVVPASTD